MSVNTDNLRPLTELNCLSQTKRLFDSRQLKYYNITETGLQEKGFLGKVWAWILDVFHLRTNLSTYIHAVNQYCYTMPVNIASLASRLVVSQSGNDVMEQNNYTALVNQMAKSILNDGLFNIPSLRALESATNAVTLRSLLEEIHAEVDIPEAIKCKGPMEQYFEFITENKRSEDYLLNAFTLDCNRMDLFVLGKEQNEKKDISITSPLFTQYCNENNLEQNPLEHRNFVEEKLKQAFASESSNATSDELFLKIKHLQMFANQTVGNDLLCLNPDYDDEVIKKMPFKVIYDEEFDFLVEAEMRAHYPRLITRFENLAAQFDAKSDSVQYKGLWNIYDGENHLDSIAKVKCVAGINFAAKSFTIIPLKKFIVSENASVTQMQRLAARFLR
jgi:hypothetical protein